MAFRDISLRIDNQSRVKVHLGYKVAKITVELPVKQFARQAVKAAFGRKARIVGGRNGHTG
jgi:hypothetical protein